MAPYIKEEERTELSVSEIQPKNAGQLNFVISTIISEYLERKGLRYENINEVMGVIACVSAEFYRRVAQPYEDKKIKENGDIDYPRAN